MYIYNLALFLTEKHFFSNTYAFVSKVIVIFNVILINFIGKIVLIQLIKLHSVHILFLVAASTLTKRKWNGKKTDFKMHLDLVRNVFTFVNKTKNQPNL